MKRIVRLSLWILIVLVGIGSAAIAQYHMFNPATITGEIGIKDVGPIMGGAIFFYNADKDPMPTATKYWAVPSFAFPVDNNAHFKAVLPEGNYYIAAVERSSGELAIPPADNEQFVIVSDAKGNPKKLNAWKDATIDLGSLVERAQKYSPALVGKGITSVQGTLRDEGGVPVEGIMVLAFSSPNMFQLPLFVSSPSDKNGKYILRFARGGKYYIMARRTLAGGAPTVGEPIGIYRSGEKPVAVRTGENRKEINLTVYGMDVKEFHH
ncbi:MAG: carboxypeptidase-like regulatory domain-containing protein [Nitrospiraceae bacterium]|nr:carboxypeptidase-like regulatory domain-containing protein [Nitrospiraceae bacterium]